jgi:hypothetical protein
MRNFVFLLLACIFINAYSISSQEEVTALLMKTETVEQRRCGDCSCTFSAAVATCCPGGVNNQALLTCQGRCLNANHCPMNTSLDCYQECYCVCTIALGCSCPHSNPMMSIWPFRCISLILNLSSPQELILYEWWCK